VALLDVDHFKRINDGHGHATGDLVLRQLADTLRGLTRQTDLVCRYGGEEFVVVMPGARFFQAEARANQWRETLSAAALDVGRTRITYTVSVGVAEHRLGAESIAETFARADEALYEAKRAGRDRVVSAEEGVTIRPGPRSPDSARSPDSTRSLPS
jgi:diguanylate cyclase (GGDEF)-like protein